MENVISLLGMQPREKYLITGTYFWHFPKMVKLRKDGIFLKEKNLDSEMLLFLFSCQILLLQFQIHVVGTPSSKTRNNNKKMNPK